MTPRSATTLGLAVTGQSHRSAVLFLHGFMGSEAEWAGITDALDHKLRCVTVDLPGHGVSTGLPDAGYTIEGAAEAVLRVLDGLEIPRVPLAGYSMGGRLALYMALRHPDRCAGLFLESASPGLEGAEERARRQGEDEEKAIRLESGDFSGFLRDWYRQPLFAPLARDGDLLRRTIEGKLRNDPAELAKSLRGMGTGRQPSLWDELPNLRVPTLSIVGELDEKFVGISRRMASLNPGIRLVVVPGVGHNVHAEAPGAYLSLLESFLASV